MGRKSSQKADTSSPYLGTLPQDMNAVVAPREVWCVHYDDCLDKAVVEKLATWSCQDCRRVLRRKYLTTTATSWLSGDHLARDVLSPKVFE